MWITLIYIWHFVFVPSLVTNYLSFTCNVPGSLRKGDMSTLRNGVAILLNSSCVGVRLLGRNASWTCRKIYQRFGGTYCLHFQYWRPLKMEIRFSETLVSHYKSKQNETAKTNVSILNVVRTSSLPGLQKYIRRYELPNSLVLNNMLIFNYNSNLITQMEDFM